MKKNYHVLLFMLFFKASALLAQPNIDICISYTGGKNLAVKLKPTGAFSGQFSNIEFTINPPSGVALSVNSASYTIALQSGTTFGHANAQSVTWTGGVEETIMTLTFSGGTGVGNFTISGYYCELGGLDKTGAVYCAASNVVLPLTLLAFTAQKQGTTAQLNWLTANEQNIQQFDIEKSSDAKTWSKIATQKASDSKNYLFQDEKAFSRASTIYYRLKIVDNDGTFRYSPTRSLTNEEKIGVHIFPNPSKGMLTFDIKKEDMQSIDIRFFNAIGQEIKRVKSQNTEGVYQSDVDVSSFSDGIYYVHIFSNNELLKNEKIVIQK